MDNGKITQVGKTLNQPVRSGRFYVISEKWYFLARDYQDQGPFDSKTQAEFALKKFLARVVTRDEMESERKFVKIKLV